MAIGMAAHITSRKISNAADRLRYLRDAPPPRAYEDCGLGEIQRRENVVILRTNKINAKFLAGCFTSIWRMLFLRGQKIQVPLQAAELQRVLSGLLV